MMKNCVGVAGDVGAWPGRAGAVQGGAEEGGGGGGGQCEGCRLPSVMGWS